MVHNEAAVAHVMGLLPELGRQVPADVSVVGIGPDELAETVSPALSSVRIPAAELGRQAVTLLMSRLAGTATPAATLLAPELTARASTAPAGQPGR